MTEKKKFGGAQEGAGRKSLSGNGPSPRVIVRFPPEIVDQLEEMAASRHIKKTEVVRELVAEALSARQHRASVSD